MSKPYEFEEAGAMLVGALSALARRRMDEGLCPNGSDEYHLLRLFEQQARIVYDLGMELVFPQK